MHLEAKINCLLDERHSSPDPWVLRRQSQAMKNIFSLSSSSHLPDIVKELWINFTYRVAL